MVKRWLTKHFTLNQFVQNLSWLGLSELFVRITRLITAIVLARLLDPVTFGIAALVLTVNELIRVFNRNGIGAKIVQCDEQELTTITNTAYRLNFIVCGILFIAQCLLAYPLAAAYNTPELVPMLQVLSLVYLFIPFGLIQMALVQRAQNMKTKAIIDGSQAAADNLITALLAVAGLGAWAIILPKFLTTPIWLIGYRRAVYWRPQTGGGNFDLWRDILNFGRYYLSIELLKTARVNLDNLIIGRLLGVEALGLYYFARNAGLGFSLSLINAANSILYPNFCQAAHNINELKTRFRNNTQKVCLIVSPLILLQALLAPWYVPWVFGEKWSAAIPILMMLCLSAVPRPLAESGSALMLAKQHIKTDFYWHGLLTVVFIISVSIAATINLATVAATIMILYWLSQPSYFWFVYHRIFQKNTVSNDT